MQLGTKALIAKRLIFGSGVRVGVSLQEMNLSLCNFLSSDLSNFQRVCVPVCVCYTQTTCQEAGCKASMETADLFLLSLLFTWSIIQLLAFSCFKS